MFCPPPQVPSFHRDQFSIFSHSLGDHSVHNLPFKLTAAAFGGFAAVEISLIDLEDHASQKGISLLEAAQEIGDLCRALSLSVTCLQPLRDVVESKNSLDGIEKATKLFPIMDALNTELLLSCSSSLPPEDLDNSLENAVANLKAMGIAAANWKPNPKKIAFEALSWGTYINLWRQAWDVVQAVNLENVGICLDSFNTLAREWADPTVEGGTQPNAHKNLKKSINQLTKIPGAKIFLLQIGDGARLKKPIEKGTIEKPALMTWSRSSRLFPMEFQFGAYLPVTEFIQAVLKTGYSGYWSLEIFNDSLKSKLDSTPIKHAIRGFLGLSNLDNFIFSNLHHNHLHLQHHHHDIEKSPSAQFISDLHPDRFNSTMSHLSPTKLSFIPSDSSTLDFFTHQSSGSPSGSHSGSGLGSGSGSGSVSVSEEISQDLLLLQT